ncbi:hypothetical protein D3C86_2065220 [compost metagenome]
MGEQIPSAVLMIVDDLEGKRRFQAAAGFTFEERIGIFGGVAGVGFRREIEKLDFPAAPDR